MLFNYFTEDEINIIADACADHSTHLKKEPRTIYGKIVCDADKDDDVLVSLKRAYEFAKNYNPNDSELELLDQTYNHLVEKFGVNGSVRYYILDGDNSEFVKEMKNLATDRSKFTLISSKTV